jgi:hypothetical protein
VARVTYNSSRSQAGRTREGGEKGLRRRGLVTLIRGDFYLLMDPDEGNSSSRDERRNEPRARRVPLTTCEYCKHSISLPGTASVFDGDRALCRCSRVFAPDAGPATRLRPDDRFATMSIASLPPRDRPPPTGTAGLPPAWTVPSQDA